MRVRSRLIKFVPRKSASESGLINPTLDKSRNRQKPRSGVVHLGDDPLDPHGDGTIRSSDPMFRLMFGGGKAIVANRRPDGEWDVQRIPEDK